MYFDSHVHFDSQPEAEIQAVLERAADADVTRCLMIGGSDGLNRGAIRAAKAHRIACGSALGYDRSHAEAVSDGRATMDGLVRTVQEYLADRDACGIRAVGEIGLDFHYTPETAAVQVDLFEAQLSLAREVQLPVVIHSRDADEATLRALTRHARLWSGAADAIGVLHCFTGSQAFAVALVDLGFHISFSGIVTFRNADPLRMVAAGVPVDKLLIETDTPYLAPVPYRGQRNEPAFVVQVAKRLAEVRGVSVESIGSSTSANACRLFGLG